MNDEQTMTETTAAETPVSTEAEATAAAEAQAPAAPAETMADYAAELEASLKKGPPEDDPVWDKFATMMADKTIFTVKVDSVVKAGVVAYVDGIRAFIPASKLSNHYVEDLEPFKGQDLDVVIITAEKAGKKLVLSAREAMREKNKADKEAKINSMEVGAVLEGTVDSLMDYGAFILLDNGLSGLLHVSQISRKRVEKPADVLKKGDKITVKIIAIKDGKISLSKKALEEPTPRDRDHESRDRDHSREGGRRDRRDHEESHFDYKETGVASTSLKDILAGIKLK